MASLAFLEVKPSSGWGSWLWNAYRFGFCWYIYSQNFYLVCANMFVSRLLKFGHSLCESSFHGYLLLGDCQTNSHGVGWLDSLFFFPGTLTLWIPPPTSMRPFSPHKGTQVGSLLPLDKFSEVLRDFSSSAKMSSCTYLCHSRMILVVSSPSICPPILSSREAEVSHLITYAMTFRRVLRDECLIGLITICVHKDVCTAIAGNVLSFGMFTANVGLLATDVHNVVANLVRFTISCRWVVDWLWFLSKIDQRGCLTSNTVDQSFHQSHSLGWRRIACIVDPRSFQISGSELPGHNDRDKRRWEHH